MRQSGSINNNVIGSDRERFDTDESFEKRIKEAMRERLKKTKPTKRQRNKQQKNVSETMKSTRL